MIDTTASLIESCLNEAAVNVAARKQFLAALKNKVLDIPAFHQAYDALINANNLQDLFGADGKLVARNTYGKVKNCPDSALAAGLKKLWVAQFSDYIKTPEEQAAHEAQKKEQERRAQELKNQIKAKEQEYLKQVEPLFNEAKQELVNLPEYISLNSVYRQFADSELVDDVTLDAHLDSLDSPVSYRLSLESLGSYYKFTAEKLTKEVICTYSLLLAENLVKDSSKKYLKNIYNDYVDDLGLEPKDASDLYLLDKYENKLYHFDDNRDSATLNLIGSDESLKLTELPDFDQLQVICIKQITSSSSGRCYYSVSYNLFYNPKVSHELLTKCGIAFKENPSRGWDNGVDICYFIDPDKIPYEYRRLGLTSGEKHSYEIDSSD